MDLSIAALSQIDYLAAITGTVSTFWVSWLWYSPLLFRKPWMKAHALTEQDMINPYALPIFLSSFGMSFLAACVVSLLLGPEATILQGMLLGGVIGICLVLPVSVPKYLMSRKYVKITLIDAAHDVLSYTTMGAFIGAMQ